MEKKQEQKELKKPRNFYPEDIVKYKNPKKKNKEVIGMVDKVFDDSDDETEDSDEEALDQGELKVDWNNGKYETVDESDVILIDRSFLHGDVVGKKDSPFDMTGIIVDLNMICDVMILDPDDEDATIVQNVNSRHLEHIHRFGNRTMFVNGNWVCSIDEITFELELEFSDESRCIVKNPDPEVLECDGHETVPFYPQMELEFETKKKQKILKEAEWIKGKYKENKHQTARVVKVTPYDLEFTWLTDGLGTEPPEDYDISKFQTFGYFCYANWCVFDKAFLPNTLIDLPVKDRAVPPTKISNLSDPNVSEMTPVEIWCTRTTCDVMWQDGSLEKDVPAINLISIEHAGDHDFWPRDFVKLKDGSDGVGFVQKVDPKNKTCIVKWTKDGSVGEYSIYEIMDHPDFEYQLGDIVVRLPSDSEQDRGQEWIGEVIAQQDDMITVFWLSGRSTTVNYTEILNAKCFIDEDEEEEEEEEEEKDEILNVAEELMEKLGEHRDSLQSNAQFSEFYNQLQSFIHIQQNQNEKKEEQREGTLDYKKNVEGYIEEDHLTPTLSFENKEEGKEEIKEEIVEIKQDVSSGGILKFSMVPDIKDHHYASTQFTPTSQFGKIIQKEWKILQQSLPEGTFIRCSEENMNLMRAIIMGPKNTPYCDGVFVFDILIPAEYPKHPPKVYFWSYGQRLNPNLYENGKVCLSLLGTWEGREDCEVWNPSKSNILQLLVSISGLVLVQSPYYNEAGYERQIGTLEGHHNSIQYSENVVYSMMSHHLRCMNNPPLHCEELIKLHYQGHLDQIVKRLSRLEKTDMDELGISGDPSVGFKLLIQKSVPKLNTKQ